MSPALKKFQKVPFFGDRWGVRVVLGGFQEKGSFLTTSRLELMQRNLKWAKKG